MCPAGSSDRRMSSSPSADSVIRRIADILPATDGFETYPFKTGNYNACVGPEFQLKYEPDCLGVLIISTPKMFDVSFKRWIQQQAKECGSFEAMKAEIRGPISEFMDARLEDVEKELSIPYELIHDHSLLPNRKPRILMCTCGHVAGAAYYYRSIDVFTDEWHPKPAAENLKFIGLSLHSRYGGHFAFRSVLLFPTIRLPADFCEKKPIPVLRNVDEIRDALEKFNYAWRDSSFRDCGNPVERYSPTQMAYFGKPPADRWSVIEHWIHEEAEDPTDLPSSVAGSVPA